MDGGDMVVFVAQDDAAIPEHECCEGEEEGDVRPKS